MNAALLAHVPLHFEYVGEIGSKPQFQRDFRVVLAEVRERQSLMQAAAPQEAAALDMNDASRQRQRSEGRQGPVREMCREHRVVLIDRCAEQRWPPAGNGELQARQHARVVREQTIVAALNVT